MLNNFPVSRATCMYATLDYNTLQRKIYIFCQKSIYLKDITINTCHNLWRVEFVNTSLST